ncbi:MAG: hypothetical protein FJ030_11180 [Chloroflexi bacterium]|nr:hypothetical protein [Chloroflexota bacterium]
MGVKLRDGEKLLYDKERVDFAVYKSAPAIHAAGSVPGLHSIKLYITDRRVIVQGAILGGVQIAEFDLWYPGKVGSPEEDMLEKVTAGSGKPGGPYVHLIARANEHGPLRSDVAELYIYTEDARRIVELLELNLAPPPTEWR